MIILDIESYFSSKDKYSLKKMSIVEYCCDPRAELICTALINTEDDAKKMRYFQGNDLRHYLKYHMPCTFIAHNAKFDLLFLRMLFPDLPWHKCKFYCTMNMFQAVYKQPDMIRGGLYSLDNLGHRLFGTHKTLDVVEFDGLTREDILADPAFPERAEKMRRYVMSDTQITADAFMYIRERLSRAQLKVINWALYNFINPKIDLEIYSVKALEQKISEQREEQLKELREIFPGKCIKPKMLSSRPQFAALVKACGYDMPTKTSPTTGKQIPQLAKTDDFILDNQNNDTDLGKLIRARIAFSSNIELSRCKTWQQVYNASKYYHYSVTPNSTWTHRLTGNNCIAHGTEVLTQHGWVPIQHIKDHHLMWDGVDWVSHEGLVFSGVQETVQVLGVWATRSHVMYCEDDQPVYHGYNIHDRKAYTRSATTQGYPIRTLRSGGRLGASRGCLEGTNTVSLLRRLWRRGVACFKNITQRASNKMPPLFNEENSLLLARARATFQGCEVTLREPKGYRLQKLWRSRNKIFISECITSGFNHGQALARGSMDRQADRSKGQQRPLRRIELAISHARTKLQQQTQDTNTQVSQERCATGSRAACGSLSASRSNLWIQPISQALARGCGTYNRYSKPMAQRTGSGVKTQRVYDIKNSGPRHRFTIRTEAGYGVLAHNSGGANPLNLPRGSILRKAIIPKSKDHLFMGFDLSGLELRIARYVARDTKAIETILSGGDMYIDFIADALRMDRNQMYIDVAQEDNRATQFRHVGKTGQLSIQYGTSGKKLYEMFKRMGLGHVVTEEQATDMVTFFRRHRHKPVADAWTFMEATMMSQCQHDSLVYDADDIRQGINLPGDPVIGGGWRWPSGTLLRYPKLYKQGRGMQGDWRYYPAGPLAASDRSSLAWDPTIKRIYPSAFFQAHIQSLANEVICDIRERIITAGYYVAMECYDELTMVVPRHRANEESAQEIQSIAESELTWWDEAPPLTAEVKIGETYYDLK